MAWQIPECIKVRSPEVCYRTKENDETRLQCPLPAQGKVEYPDFIIILFQEGRFKQALPSKLSDISFDLDPSYIVC